MALYWRLKSVPELKDLSEDVRRDAADWAGERASAEGRLVWPLYVMLIPSLVAIGIAGAWYFGAWNIYRQDHWWDFLVVAVAFVIGGALGILIGKPMVLSRIRPYIREYLVGGS